MKKNFRLLLFLLVMVLSISVLTVTAQNNGGVFLSDEKQIEVTWREKIDEELWAVLEEASDDELIQVYVWIADIDYEKVENEVKRTTGFSSDSFEIEQDDFILSADFMSRSGSQNARMREYLKETEEERAIVSQNVDTYVMASREMARKEYNTMHSSFERNHLRNADILFQSQYAPMIICEVSKADVYRLAKLEQIVFLDLYVELLPVIEGDLNFSIPSIGADYSKGSLGLNGDSSVVIGIYDDGHPRIDAPDFISSNIDRIGAYSPGSHASVVSAIMVGQRGIVPNAKLVSLSYDAFGYYEAIERLVNEGVHVINVSLGYASDGQYDIQAKWTDHIIYQHNVSYVKSAGNRGTSDAYITSPGTAYNVIAAGGINDRGTLSLNDDYMYAGSSYVTMGGAPHKPDVLAPAEGFYTSWPGNNYGGSGTSFAAPHVVGVIAQLMQAKPELRTQPHLVKAMIMASCDRKVRDTLNGSIIEPMDRLTNKQGAGVINSTNAVFAGGYTGALSANTNVYEVDVPMIANIDVSIVLTWFMRHEATSNHNSGAVINPNLTLTDLDVEIYNSNNVLVASSYSRTNNAEYVRFAPASSGLYKVRVIRYTNNSTVEKFSIAYATSVGTSGLEVSARASDLEFNGAFTYSTIEIVENDSLAGAVYVELKKHSGANVTTEPVRQILIDQSGVGKYMNVPASVNCFTGSEHIEIIIYADNLKQNLLTRQFIHPVVLAF